MESTPLEAWFESLPDEYVRVSIPDTLTGPHNNFVFCASKTKALMTGHPINETCEICKNSLTDGDLGCTAVIK